MSAREHFDDPRMERLQIRIRRLEEAFAKVVFLDGALVENVVLTTSSSQVSHRLGRVPRGFFPVRVTPDGAIGFSAAQPTDTTKFANLEASASVTADIWFF